MFGNLDDSSCPLRWSFVSWGVPVGGASKSNLYKTSSVHGHYCFGNAGLVDLLVEHSRAFSQFWASFSFLYRPCIAF